MYKWDSPKAQKAAHKQKSRAEQERWNRAESAWYEEGTNQAAYRRPSNSKVRAKGSAQKSGSHAKPKSKLNPTAKSWFPGKR